MLVYIIFISIFAKENRLMQRTVYCTYTDGHYILKWGSKNFPINN